MQTFDKDTGTFRVIGAKRIIHSGMASILFSELSKNVDGIGGCAADLVRDVEDAMRNGDPELKRALRARFGGGGACEKVESKDLPLGCVSDGKGNVFVRASGRLIQVSRPETLRMKVLWGTIIYDAATGGNTLSLEIKPQVDMFVSRRIGLQAGGPTGAPSNNQAFVTGIKIGTNDQQSANIGNVSGGVGESAANFSLLQYDATDTGSELDPATPNKTILFNFRTTAIAAAVPDSFISVAVWGLAWDGALPSNQRLGALT